VLNEEELELAALAASIALAETKKEIPLTDGLSQNTGNWKANRKIFLKG
jgi:hypothetical protein